MRAARRRASAFRVAANERGHSSLSVCRQPSTIASTFGSFHAGSLGQSKEVPSFCGQQVIKYVPAIRVQ